MYYARAWKNKDYCTIMYHNPWGLCRDIPYFSSPHLSYDGQTIGNRVTDNAGGIKENRFLLENVGDESISCEEHFYGDLLWGVNCMAKAWLYLKNYTDTFITETVSYDSVVNYLPNRTVCFFVG